VPLAAFLPWAPSMLSLLDTLQGEALLPVLKVPSQSSMKGVAQKAVLESLEGAPPMRSLLDAPQGQVLLLALHVLCSIACAASSCRLAAHLKQCVTAPQQST